MALRVLFVPGYSVHDAERGRVWRRSFRRRIVYPPIPIRTMDWSAIDDDGYDGAPERPRQRRSPTFSNSSTCDDLVPEALQLAPAMGLPTALAGAGADESAGDQTPGRSICDLAGEDGQSRKLRCMLTGRNSPRSRPLR